jgi:hypothetical protein
MSNSVDAENELASLKSRIRTIEVRTTVTAWDALSRQQATGNPDEIERANHARKLGQAALNAVECEKNPCPDGGVEFVSRLTVLIPSDERQP